MYRDARQIIVDRIELMENLLDKNDTPGDMAQVLRFSCNQFKGVLREIDLNEKMIGKYHVDEREA